jgi:hypothetical protein
MENTGSQIVQTTPIKLSKIADMQLWYNDFVTFSKSILKKDLDFGDIPNVAKPSLFKPGAEKLRLAYNLSSTIEKTDSVKDLETGYISFDYKCTIKTQGGQILAECEGNANSYETKFRYNWVKEVDLPQNIDKEQLKTKASTISEFKFAIDKAETTGQYGKPREYWERWNKAIEEGRAKRLMKKVASGKEFEAYEIESKVYRIQNEDILGMQNTIMKMSQKRAFVGAVLMATGASEFFTQDVEDMELTPVDDLPKVVATSDTTKTEVVSENKDSGTDTDVHTKVEEGEVVKEKSMFHGNDGIIEDEIFEKPTQAQLRIIEKFIEQGKLKKEDVNLVGLTMESAKQLIKDGQK